MRLTQTQRRQRRGQTMMEYVLIICLIAAAIAATVYLFGDELKKAFTGNTELVTKATGKISDPDNPLPPENNEGEGGIQ